MNVLSHNILSISLQTSYVDKDTIQLYAYENATNILKMEIYRNIYYNLIKINAYISTT